MMEIIHAGVKLIRVNKRGSCILSTRATLTHLLTPYERSINTWHLYGYGYVNMGVKCEWTLVQKGVNKDDHGALLRNDTIFYLKDTGMMPISSEIYQMCNPLW